MFGEASGLRINCTKSWAIVTRGDHRDHDEERIAPILQRSIGAFPCKYLGLQLAILSLTKAEWQPTLDSIRACLRPSMATRPHKQSRQTGPCGFSPICSTRSSSADF
uniref:Uncharacterized protein n=1 Tax=Aegilops tauschii subsp. strangulata TaxID=200361 RepID=A0A453M8U4_AEGTS